MVRATFSGFNTALSAIQANQKRLDITGQNLFTITKYTGIDPEVSLSGLAPGIDNRNYYPKTRSFLLGVNISF